MAERLTNNYAKFIAEIALELKRAIPETSVCKTKFIYTELPSVRPNKFSIHYLIGPDNKLLLRYWNWPFDIQKGQFGIWNLDRVAIAESEIQLSTEESRRVNTSIQQSFETSPLEGVVLDSTHYNFRLFNKEEQTYQWHLQTQLKPEFIILFEYIKQLSNVKNSLPLTDLLVNL